MEWKSRVSKSQIFNYANSVRIFGCDAKLYQKRWFVLTETTLLAKKGTSPHNRRRQVMPPSI